MRKPRMHTWTWWKFSTMRRERFAEVLGKHPDLFDKDFIEAIQKRRMNARSMSLKLVGVQMPIFIFLVLSLIPVQASVTIFGVSPAGSKNLREVLIVASALLGVATSVLNHYSDIVSELVSAYVDRRSKGNKEIAEFLGLASGTNYLIMPNWRYGEAKLGGMFLTLAGLIALLGITLLVATFGGAIYVHYLVLRDIFFDPSFSRTASVWVIGFVLACDCFTLLLGVLNVGGIPLKDFTNMYAVAKINERDPEKGKKLYQAIVKLHRQRPWIIRHLVRIKMPKKLPSV